MDVSAEQTGNAGGGNWTVGVGTSVSVGIVVATRVGITVGTMIVADRVGSPVGGATTGWLHPLSRIKMTRNMNSGFFMDVS